jgi:hypothetical protein
MKDMATIFDDLGYLYTEESEEFARSAKHKLDQGLTPIPHLAEAEAQVSMAHSLAHIAALLEVIAEHIVSRP